MLNRPATLVLLSLSVAAGQPIADPAFVWPGNYAIRPDPSPGIVGGVNEITVAALNYGDTAATDVEVQLNFNDWGVTYSGWQEIGTVLVDIPASGNVEHIFNHVFENRAHTCLEAKIVSVGGGGNSDLTNDRTQINWEVVHAGEDVSIYVPFGNGANEEIVINGTDILCMVNDTFVPCPGRPHHGDGWQDDVREALPALPALPAPNVEVGDDKRFEVPAGRRLLQSSAPYLQNAPTSLPPFGEQVAELVVPDVPEEGMVVMVQAEMNGELNHVLIQVVRTTVAELLNKAHLCCLKSVRHRVLLESILRDALLAYEDGDCARAIKLLRKFIQRATNLLCELSEEEKACIEKALIQIVDAGRMIALELGSSKLLHTYIREGDYFRRQGVYEAALMEYARGC